MALSYLLHVQEGRLSVFSVPAVWVGWRFELPRACIHCCASHSVSLNLVSYEVHFFILSFVFQELVGIKSAAIEKTLPVPARVAALEPAAETVDETLVSLLS